MNLDRTNLEILRDIAESAPYSVIAITADTRVVVFNRKACELHGLPEPKYLTPDSWADGYAALLAEDGRRLEPEEYPSVRALREQREIEMTLLFQGADHQTRRAKVRSRPLYDSEKNVIGAVSTHELIQ